MLKNNFLRDENEIKNHLPTFGSIKSSFPRFDISPSFAILADAVKSVRNSHQTIQKIVS
ncbi:hypothetical protein BGZ63DRAFT_389484 [Mariannaea sp. PMI_226]|nr:hypothetical protein BGZ63DRAFT_389484 [Mariannaea sp. PMI_226]